ncbi:MAG: hypothetical protein H7249_07865 [Chitinophagaceae bacterium]|nr:hypothetical protein [Oligoflexus sp.]
MPKSEKNENTATKEELDALGKGLWLSADECKLSVKELIYLLDVSERTHL